MTFNDEHQQHTPETSDYKPSLGLALRFSEIRTRYLSKEQGLGYLARILNGKLVRVARVTPSGVDYNYEHN